VLAVSAHLTDRDRELVRLVARHRVLTTEQLAALKFSNLTTARHRLSVLVCLGVLRRFRPHRETGSAPWHYVLGPVGAAMLGQEDRDERKWAPQVRADRQLALERSQRLSHMTGTSWFFVSLARHARENGRELGELTEWLNEAETVTSFNHATGSVDLHSRFPHPDGAGTWAQDGRQVQFLLEYDTGSENLSVLTGKLDGYQALAGGMAYNDQMCPVVLFCFTSPRREQSARRALAATREAPALRIATAAIDPRTVSPAGPVWLPLLSRTGHQVPLIDLDDAIPDPWLAYRQDQAPSAARPPNATACTATTKTTRTGGPPSEDHALLPAGLPRMRPRVRRRMGSRRHHRCPDLPRLRARVHRDLERLGPPPGAGHPARGVAVPAASPAVSGCLTPGPLTSGGQPASVRSGRPALVGSSICTA
jgi:hypothetical protein